LIKLTARPRGAAPIIEPSKHQDFSRRELHFLGGGGGLRTLKSCCVSTQRLAHAASWKSFASRHFLIAHDLNCEVVRAPRSLSHGIFK
jgi:hypothetical protein